MNNKVYMRAVAVASDPAFIEQVSEGKNQDDTIFDLELLLSTDMAAVANTCIAINPSEPDFISLASFLVMHERSHGESLIGPVKYYILGLIELAWGLISRFFPLVEYGFPSVNLWAWILRCIVSDEIPEPMEIRYPVIYTLDTDQLILRARMVFLEELLKENGIYAEYELAARGYEERLNRIAEILATEPRCFVEVLPGTSLYNGLSEAGGRVKILIGETHANPESHKIPQDYKSKLKRYFIPRQFRGKKLDEMARDLRDDRSTSNISREYNELAKKAGYEPVPPRLRGKGRD